MEWTIRLEAKTGWGEVETVELVSITRPVLAQRQTASGFPSERRNRCLPGCRRRWLAGRWPNIYTPDAASISALRLVSEKAAGYFRPKWPAAPWRRGSSHGRIGVAMCSGA